ncbi:MAG: hypothetical protein ACLU4B_01515 [Bilophila wadsworthia]
MVRSAGGKSGDGETIVGVNRDGGFGSAVWWARRFVSCCATFRELAPLTRRRPRHDRQAQGRQVATGFRGARVRRGNPSDCSSIWQPCAARWAQAVARPNPVMVLPEGEGVRIVDIVMQVAPARHCGETD